MDEVLRESRAPREYEGFGLAEEVQEPSYAGCLDWMRSTSGSSASYDVWARGNFTRRLLHHRATNVRPLVVQVCSVPEMRWAYRRLALLGCPIEFVYTGPLPAPGRILHLFPWDSLHDCGWGYIAALTPVTIQGRKWFTVLGTARLMPEDIPNWIMNEAPKAFSGGDVFVAPAPLIGIDVESTGLAAFTEVTRGSAIVPAHLAPAATLLNLDLPYIDGMEAHDFEEFLEDNAGELREFRTAFADLVHGGEPLSAASLRLESEVAELTRAARHEQLRVFASKCGGSLRTFSFAMVALAGAGAAYAGDPFAGAAVVGTAAKMLKNLWTESRRQAGDTCPHPYRILWKLGVERANLRSRVVVGKWPQRQPTLDDVSSTCHWLCPPTNGLLYLAMRKESREGDGQGS